MENKRLVGTIVILGGLALFGLILYNILPMLISVAFNVVNLAIMLLVIVLVIYAIVKIGTAVAKK